LCNFFESFVYTKSRAIRSMRSHSFDYISYSYNPRFQKDLPIGKAKGAKTPILITAPSRP